MIDTYIAYPLTLEFALENWNVLSKSWYKIYADDKAIIISNFSLCIAWSEISLYI